HRRQITFLLHVRTVRRREQRADVMLPAGGGRPGGEPPFRLILPGVPWGFVVSIPMPDDPIRSGWPFQLAGRWVTRLRVIGPHGGARLRAQPEAPEPGGGRRAGG